jgi:ribosome-binding protein aMBF1 (putative translation factor)
MKDLIFTNVQKNAELKECTQKFTERLVTERQQAKFSQEFMADWLGISTRKLQMMEKCEVIDLPKLFKYAEKFGVDITIIANFEE